VTKIVPLSSLTEEQRKSQIVPHSNTSSCNYEDDDFVEVWIPNTGNSNVSKDGTAAAATATTSSTQRPLVGNLSSKLSEYTRGQVSRRQPFWPGGMDREEKTHGVSSTQEEEEAEDEKKKKEKDIEEKVELMKDILLSSDKKMIVQAWQEGKLLTAPPGVSFQVGLRLEDVYSQQELEDMGYSTSCDKDVNTGDVEGKENFTERDILQGTTSSSSTTTASTTPAEIVNKLWDKSFFDDDSLFGEDDEEDEDESSDTDDDDDHDHDDDKDDKSSSSGSSDSSVQDNTRADNDLSNEMDDVQDIDQLISELTLTTTTSKVEQFYQNKQKKSSVLSLANAQYRNRPNKNPLTSSSTLTTTPSSSGKKKKQTMHKDRKCWAVTTPLPLGDFHSILPNPAITYPFELDEFQKQAVARLERGECIFVAAHTSAGKTVCAEYAIALARKHCTRAIYTSPIKALSNQKYRDFKDRFGDDVGLITGDLQINADSSCLIMTTEILRSMLYRGADLIRDIEWVIFDEVHYINDTERGVVWEEVIIMLPEYVNMIFLSATTPNTKEFSDWIGRTKKKPVHVIKTDYRPVPLSHYLYAGKKLHKVMEGQSGFLEKGYKEAALALMPLSERQKKEHGAQKKPGVLGGSKQNSATARRVTGSTHSAWQQSGSRQDWNSLVRFLEREELMPTVVFSFSKKKCEEIAHMLQSLDLNTAAERNSAQLFAIQTMKRLSPKDASLPQVIATCEMVKRGIGVHHGGLLPILKEMVEILFSRNLIKVLFATETFAMGVNMPARAVVFNSIRKHDGSKFRTLEPGEYTQMAGRAGRRGLDKVGTVIMCCFGEEPPPQLILRNMLTGLSTRLSSQFRLTYNMILNLLRVEDMTVEGMIKRSFSEFATQRALSTNEYPKLLNRGAKALAKLEDEFVRDADIRIGAEDISEYFGLSSKLLTATSEGLNCLLSAVGNTAGGSLVPGRILLVTSARKKGLVRAPAIVVQSPQLASATKSVSSPAVCITLLPNSYDHVTDDNKPKPKEFHLNYIGTCKNRKYLFTHVELDEILFISQIKHKIDPRTLYKDESSLGGAHVGAVSASRATNSFFNLKPVTRQVDDFGFGHLKARGKEDLLSSSSKTVEDEAIEKIITLLIEAEAMEDTCSLEVLPLKECSKGGTFQGDDAFRLGNLSNQICNYATVLRTYKSHFHPSLLKHYITVEKKETLSTTVKALRHLLSNESLQLFPDFLQRKSLLKTLNYIDENDTVKVKGRVACECNTCEELIVTEMVFEGLLNDLDPPEIVAALSALIFQEKTDNDLDPEIPERLKLTCEAMKKIALSLGQLQNDHGLLIEPTDYCNSSLKFGLVHVVYDWALGVPFSNICQLTAVQEGSIVRCITRLDELCREVRNCARVVGNPTLYRMMEEASVAIKRDIVFASSLYVT